MGGLTKTNAKMIDGELEQESIPVLGGDKLPYASESEKGAVRYKIDGTTFTLIVSDD